MTKIGGLLHIAVCSCLVAIAAASSANASACRFGSLSEASRTNPLARASYSARQWVEHQEKSARVRALLRATETTPGISAAQVLTVGFFSLAALDKISTSHPLHRCFEEALISEKKLDTYFPGIFLVKGQFAQDAPYAMVIPKNVEEPVVLVTPESMFQLQRTTGSLQVFNKELKVYVEVEPRAHRSIDHIIQSNLANLQN